MPNSAGTLGGYCVGAFSCCSGVLTSFWFWRVASSYLGVMVIIVPFLSGSPAWSVAFDVAVRCAWRFVDRTDKIRSDHIRSPFHDLDNSGHIDRSLIYIIGKI